MIHWSENLYYQYFSGCMAFTPDVPCSSTELVEFRKRIGIEGMELIFKESIRVNDKDGNDDILTVDTTVQGKNITKAQRKKHSRRTAIEQVIGHLKYDYRLIRNFLKGSIGDSINLLLSAAAFNFKRVINLWLTEAIHCWQLLLMFIRTAYGNCITLKIEKTTF
ncbi:MAG: hypothetical protein KIT64_03025 [Chitinophagaceae bacterium]|nr:hypothetical protein [Chitinophagaceae bacterium]